MNGFDKSPINLWHHPYTLQDYNRFMKLNSLLFDSNIPEHVVLTMKPRSDQIEDFFLLDELQRGAIYSEVGTGKSMVSYLYIMSALYQRSKVLVLMPPPLIPQYRRNFEAIVRGHEFTNDILVKNIAKRNKKFALWDKGGWPDVLFVSYQMYLRYSKKFMAAGYGTLVADEAHMASNASSKTFQEMFFFVHRGKARVLLMTATPMPTEVRSAYGQIRLRHLEFYSSIEEFDRLHTIYAAPNPDAENKNIKIITGYKDIDVVEQRLMTGAVRRRAKDVLTLKELNIIEQHVELEEDHAALYKKLLLERMLELGDELLVARNSQALRQMALQIITNIDKFTDPAAPPIEDWPLEQLKLIIQKVELTKNKLIVFCHFKDTVLKLSRVFAEYNPALVYGDSDKPTNVNKFLNDPTCRLGILNFRSGGSGLNLQSDCHHVVIYEATGSPADIVQGIGRVHRGGQEHPVIAWIFKYRFTLSGRLFGKAYNRALDIQEAMADDESFVDHIKSL